MPSFGSSKLVSTWLVAMIAASVVAYVDGGFTAHWLALEPSLVFRGQVWRLATWALVEHGPMALVMTCLCIYKFGGELAERWGERRLRGYVVALVVLAGLATSLLSLVTGEEGLWRCGGMVVMNVLVIGWARQFPDRDLTFYGIVALRGTKLIGLVVGIAVLFALRFGFVELGPEVVACTGAVLFPLGS